MQSYIARYIVQFLKTTKMASYTTTVFANLSEPQPEFEMKSTGLMALFWVGNLGGTIWVSGG